MSAPLKLPPISLSQKFVSQDVKRPSKQNTGLKSVYTSTMKQAYQQPTQYPGCVLRAVAAYMKSKTLGNQFMNYFTLECLIS